MNGLVIAAHRSRIVVEDEAQNLVSCRANRSTTSVVVGDEVEWVGERAGYGRIEAVLPRRSLLSRSTPTGLTRPVAANVDLVMIVVAPQPKFSTRLLDRYLVVAEYSGIDAALVVNKVDLLASEELHEVETELAVYGEIGYPMHWISTKTGRGLADIEAVWRSRVTVLAGQSGVGKSSILQTLSPESDIDIGQLSTRTNLGRHTTSGSKLYRTKHGGRVIDTPGVLDFALWHVPEEALDRCFPEFEPHLDGCRFSNCRHLREPGCALAAATTEGHINAERFASYKAMRLEQS